MILRSIGARTGIHVFFGFGILKLSNSLASDLSRESLRARLGGEPDGYAGYREGSDDPLPRGPIPAVLRDDEADPPGPFQQARVRLHVLEPGNCIAPQRIRLNRGVSRIPDQTCAGTRLLLKRLLREPSREHHGKQGLAGRRFDLRPRRGPPPECSPNVLSRDARSDPDQDPPPLRRLPQGGFWLR